LNVCSILGHPDAGLYFHPYRKPKRIRTAFSPTQLLKLEHSFEKNHYVVGQERKELASKLNLTETQVRMESKEYFYILAINKNEHTSKRISQSNDITCDLDTIKTRCCMNQNIESIILDKHI